tara:strand:- start:22 stop:456 length:435 start_codon:yes stop_codon:yes gene_type:complete
MSRKGIPNKLTKAVKDRVEQAFNKVNGPANAGLIQLAQDHPAIFYSLVAKCIPAAVAVSLDHHLDLGLAMRQGKERLNVIDNEPTQSIVSPDTLAPDTLSPGKVERETVSGDSGTVTGEPGKAFKQLRRQRKRPGGGRGVPPDA